jgi:hypothetical protein
MHSDQPPTDAPLAVTPFSAELRAAIGALYALAPTHVPKTLLVCRCAVCMSEATLAQIIATPVRDLPPELMQEYSNSAHGDPSNPDDLNALLPRYLDLIAQDIEVDRNSVGADLKRFGDARGRLPGFPAPGMEAEMDRIGRFLILHFGALQALGDEAVETPWSLLQLLLIGGWPPALLTDAVDELFAHPQIGRAALIGFLADMGGSLQDGQLIRWALARYRPDLKEGLAAWIGRLLDAEATSDILTDPRLPEDKQVWITPLAGLRGRMTASVIGG